MSQGQRRMEREGQGSRMMVPPLIHRRLSHLLPTASPAGHQRHDQLSAVTSRLRNMILPRAAHQQRVDRL